MDGPDDCGKSQGNGKDDESEYNNNWLFGGLVGSNGMVVADCAPDEADGIVFTENCLAQLPPSPSCDTIGKPDTLTFKYIGGGCDKDANSQEDKSSCSESSPGVGMDPEKGVSVTGDGLVGAKDVSPNGEFTISRKYNEMTLTLEQDNTMVGSNMLTEMIEFHTSCSKPLILGERYGSLELVALNEQSGGVDVTYQYVVTNNGSPLGGVTVVDDLLGDVSDSSMPFDLNSGGNQTFTLTARIKDTTTNIATVNGVLESEDVCTETDSTTVVVEAPPCDPSKTTKSSKGAAVNCPTTIQGAGTTTTEVQLPTDDGAGTSTTSKPADTVTTTSTEECDECDGGVTVLKLKNIGAAAGVLQIMDNKLSLIDRNVDVGEEFEIVGSESDGKFDENNLEVSFNGVAFDIHVSCSKPIGVGVTIGNLQVTGGRSKNGGPLCDCEFDGGCKQESSGGTKSTKAPKGRRMRRRA
jgi:hypothetical protein